MLRFVQKLSLLAAVAMVVVFTMQPKSANAQEPLIGQIQTFGFNFAPRGWALCDGQLLSISQNTALFSLLGTTYGGDGRTTFALPDLRGRVPIHMGTGPGLSSRLIGARAGTETNTLSIANMPSHSHTVTARANSGRGNSADPTGNVWAQKKRAKIYKSAAPDVDMSADAILVGSTGGGQSVNNMQPYLVINYSIALTGIFPSRN